MGLIVRRPGLFTTLQDRGRPGAQALGVPVSGALDPEALWLANVLVGNPPGEAALEILHVGPEFEVAAHSVRVALAAFDGGLTVDGAPFPPWRSVTVRRGQILAVQASRRAASAILAVAGGFAATPVLGSRSTFVRGGFGGFAGRPLAAGDVLGLALDRAPDRPDLALARALKGEEGPLRMVPGPQDDHFLPEALEILTSAEYRVGRDADRMGLRLEGPALPHARGHDIVSDPIACGALQVPGDGRPVLLLADRQTIGGYPKIACVCTADLARAGRLRPGDAVRFEVVGLDQALALARARRAELAALAAALVPAAEAARLDLDALYGANLISGVVAAEG